MNKLTPQTITVLKNFSDINKNLFVKKGNVLSTISEAENILCYATIEQKFDQDFGIYDLNEFLGAYGLFSDPDVEFDESSVIISSGKSKVHYRFANESILTYPTKKINMPTADLTIKITSDVLTQLRKAGAALGNTIISITREGKKIVLSAINPKNVTANTFSITLDEETDSKADFDFQFSIANIKIIPGNYEVNISSKLISNWKNENDELEYFIALETASKFN